MSYAIYGDERKDHGDKPHDYDERADDLVENTEVMVKIGSVKASASDPAEAKPIRKQICVGGRRLLDQGEHGGWYIAPHCALRPDDLRRLRAALDVAIKLDELDIQVVTVTTVDEE